MIGQTVSHYQITEKLGQGGMGVVYKALDTKLDRSVALKFLPAHSLPTDDDKARFHREAKAAAKLNHPHIATVYEIDETDDGQAFIAMEYVEGETLAERIKQGPLKLQEAITITTQVAEGLQAAHEQGVVHRDIKSSNVMLTERGGVKVMDFGLAKTDAATMLTKEGTALGTVAYMSPEQARGGEVDHRTDLWSLGVVLYEMIVGRLPFAADYEQAMIYSILNEDPEALTGLRTGVPMDLERVVNKLLAKEAEERYQHVDEMLVDLRTLKKNLPALIKKTSTGSLAFYEHKRTRWQVVVPWSITIMAVGAAIVLWSLWRLAPLPERPLMRFTHSLPPGQTFEYGLSVSLSPDGSQLVYVASDSSGGIRLYRRPIDQFESRPISGTEGARNPFFSPDGQWVGFFAGGKLKKVSLVGGAPVTICDAQSGYGASWGADGTIIFSPTFKGLLRVSAAGGTPQTLTTIKAEQGELAHRWPEILPDGKSVLYTIITGMPTEPKHIAVLSLASGKQRIVVENGRNARYTSAGYLIYSRARSLLAAPFDVERLEVTGLAIRVLDDIMFSGVGYSISRNGTLVWITAESSAGGFRLVEKRLLTWVDRAGHTQQLQLSSLDYWAPKCIHANPVGLNMRLHANLAYFCRVNPQKSL